MQYMLVLALFYLCSCFLLSALSVRFIPRATISKILRTNHGYAAVLPVLIFAEAFFGSVNLVRSTNRRLRHLFEYLSGRRQQRRVNAYYRHERSARRERR